MSILNRFGLWYLATLAPAVALFLIAWSMAPLQRAVAHVISAVVATGAMPILAIVMVAASLALRVDTDRLLPRWYRRLFSVEHP